jgi:hypothetical protein
MAALRNPAGRDPGSAAVRARSALFSPVRVEVVRHGQSDFCPDPGIEGELVPGGHPPPRVQPHCYVFVEAAAGLIRRADDNLNIRSPQRFVVVSHSRSEGQTLVLRSILTIRMAHPTPTLGPQLVTRPVHDI